MKRYIIYAGVNGAGKSTLHRTPAHRGIRDFPRINTEQFLRFAEYEQGKMVFLNEDIMPQWFKQNILQGS